MKSFEIETEFLLSSDLSKQGFKTENKKSLYVLDLIKYLQGTKFLFGKNYWKYFTVDDKKAFKENNVEYLLQEFDFKELLSDFDLDEIIDKIKKGK